MNLEEVDVHNLEQINEILESLQTITIMLASALDRNVVIKNQVYCAIAEHKISSKLSMESKLIELIKCGKGEWLSSIMKARARYPS